MRYEVKDGRLMPMGTNEQVRELMRRAIEFFDANPTVRLDPDEFMAKFDPDRQGRGLQYMSADGELKPWPTDGKPVDVNTDPRKAVQAVAAAVEKSEPVQSGIQNEAKTTWR